MPGKSKSKSPNGPHKPKAMKKVSVRTAAKAASSINNLLKSAATTIGTAIGGPGVGHLAGSAAKYVSHLLGQGAYSVRGNTVLTDNQIPTFSSTGSGIRIRHREYVTDISGSTLFTTQQQWFLNPGNSTCFPWLSTIADSFESYRMHGCVVEFKSTSANALNSTNTALGVVILSSVYNVEDLAFVNKQQAEAYEFSTSCKPAESMIHPVECARGANPLEMLFVTTATSPAGLPSTADPRLYFPCYTQVMTEGMQAVADIGELWISYDISLIRPHLPSPLGSEYPSFHGYGTAASGVAFNVPMTIGAGSTLSSVVSIVSNTQLAFTNGDGRYFIYLRFAGGGSSISGASGSFSGGTGLTFPNTITSTSSGNELTALKDEVFASGGNYLTFATIFDISGSSQGSGSVVLTAPTPTLSGSVYYDLYITRIGSGLTAHEPTHAELSRLLQDFVRERGRVPTYLVPSPAYERAQLQAAASQAAAPAVCAAPSQSQSTWKPASSSSSSQQSVQDREGPFVRSSESDGEDDGHSVPPGWRKITRHPLLTRERL